MTNFTRWVSALALSLSAAVVACSSAMHATPGASQPASASELAAARAAIEPQFQEMLAAANAHDTDRHLAAYERSPELVFVANDRVIHGWDALHAQQLEWWQHGKSDAVYEPIGTTEYSMPAPDVVILTYLLDSHRSGAAGAARGAHLGVTNVWRRTTDGWRIVYAHESVVPR